MVPGPYVFDDLALSKAGTHACGIRPDGSAWCWGPDIDGRLDAPVGPTFVEIDAGNYFTCALDDTGKPWCWGKNDYGQTAPPAGAVFTSITTGPMHACGLRPDGKAVCWGFNDSGQAPSLTSLSFKAIVAADLRATCGLKLDGTVTCWGSVPYLGAVPSGTFTELRMAQGNACAGRADGTWICWGNNAQHVDELPSGLFTDVEISSYLGCGLRTDGSATCWGTGLSNASGTLTPPAGVRFTDLTASDRHMCGFRDDGTTVCWGTYANPPWDAPDLSDVDRDALSAADEAWLGTDPARDDSDGDGFTDGREVLAEGTDPKDAASHP